MKPIVWGTLAGFVGMLLALACWTAWEDHQRLTALWVWAAQQQATAAAAAGGQHGR